MGNYGAVWSQPASVLNEIKIKCESKHKAFREALEKGYFSQYTSYRQRDLVQRIINWQLNLLAKWIGNDLSKLPVELNELSIIPEVLLFDFNGRILSPDLLRNLWYVLFLIYEHSLLPSENIKNILEIGSGYGSFARILKAYYHSACIWLIDLPESLVFAKIYLEKAYPDAKIILIDTPNINITNFESYDFILVPVTESAQLIGRQFDLAVNIWSFGEMPNEWIEHWFDLLQNKCVVNNLFLLNAFSAPVTFDSTDRVKQGNWLFQLDEKWIINEFFLDPEIHQCSYVRNFYTGLAIFAKKINSDAEMQSVKSIAQNAIDDVLLEDWVTIALSGGKINNFERPEVDVVESLANFDELFRSVSITKLLAITEYIGHPRFEVSLNTTFFNLWNCYRVNKDVLSGVLLVVYLAMVNKTQLNYRCSKEELFILQKIPACLLQEEYHQLIQKETYIEYNDNMIFLDEALNLTADKFRDGDYDQSKELTARILIKIPDNVDLWHQLSLIYEIQGDILLAAIICKHTCLLAPNSQLYVSTYQRLLHKQKNVRFLKKVIYQLASQPSERYRKYMLQIINIIPGEKIKNLTFLIIAAGYIFSNVKSKYLIMINDVVQAKYSGSIKEAFNKSLLKHY